MDRFVGDGVVHWTAGFRAHGGQHYVARFSNPDIIALVRASSGDGHNRAEAAQHPGLGNSDPFNRIDPGPSPYPATVASEF